MADPYYVPVEDRWLGLDKRAIPYAVVMIALIGLMTYVLPAINDAVDWDDEIRAGDVIDLGEGLTITPPVGWLLEDGVRVSDDLATPVDPESARAALASGGVSVSVGTSGWDGTADDLLDQSNKLRDDSDADEDKLFKVTGPRDTVTTSSNVTGVREPFTSASGSGEIFAFAVPGDEPIGVVITVTGSGDNLGGYDDAIDNMVSSLTKTEATS